MRVFHAGKATFLTQPYLANSTLEKELSLTGTKIKHFRSVRALTGLYYKEFTLIIFLGHELSIL